MPGTVPGTGLQELGAISRLQAFGCNSLNKELPHRWGLRTLSVEEMPSRQTVVTESCLVSELLFFSLPS